ncbi:MAG: PD-(D/E)XK nuclease family protein [Opitutales bacterium]|nr:PD-(D/E)XK nuclease family protein [Opitutales bacterium]
MSCPHCGSVDATRAGRRVLKSGEERQLYRCNACFRRFSNRNRAGKKTDPEIILRALILVCSGYNYSDALAVLRREFGSTVPTKSSLSRWLSSFPLPWLDVRDRLLRPGELPVRAHLFTHAKLPYEYQIHLPKLRFAKAHGGLADYLTGLPQFLDHSLFERAAHCSGLRLAENPGLRHTRDIGLTRLAAAAVSLAPNNRRRHAALENYFLYGDRNTVAVEVPVYYYDKVFDGLIAGHIDLVQVWPDKVRLLDYKPNAASENPARVVTQLSLYAHALRFRAHLPPGCIECVYFDEKDAYFFEPAPIRAAPPEDRALVEADTPFQVISAETGSPSGPAVDQDGFSVYPADQAEGAGRMF